MKKILTNLSLVCLMVLVMCVPAFADTNGTLKANVQGPVTLGSTYQVQVELTGDAELSDIDMFLDYTSALTDYVSGDAAEKTANGQVRLRKEQAQTADNRTYTWNLEFQANTVGDARFAFVNVFAKNADQASAGSELMNVTTNASTVNITADAAQTADVNAVQTISQDSAQPVEDPLAALEQQILSESELSALVGSEKVYVEETFPDSDFPIHFVEARVFYKGVEIRGAQLNNTNFVTVMTDDGAGNNRTWVIYDQEHTKFYTLDKIMTDVSSFVILQPPAPELIPENFTETVLDMGMNQYTAWKTGGFYTEGGAAANPDDFYLVYGYNQNGHLGWFIYDAQQSSFQRYVQFTGEELSAATGAAETEAPAADDNDENEALINKYNFILNCAKYGGIAILALLIILLIINIVSGRKDDEEEYEEEAPKESRKERRQKKKEAQKANLEKVTDEDGFVDDYNLKESPDMSDYIQKDEKKTGENTEQKNKFDNNDEVIGALKPVSNEGEAGSRKEDTAVDTGNTGEILNKSIKEAIGDAEEADAEAKKTAEIKDDISESLNRISEEIRRNVEKESKDEDTNVEESLTFINLDD